VLANRVREEKLAACVCGKQDISLEGTDEEFEAQFHRPCPVHKERLLRNMMFVLIEVIGGGPHPVPKQNERLAEYRRRRARQLERRLEDDSEEL
jgi:hypothetical protein